MTQEPTGKGAAHLELEQIGQAADGLEPLSAEALGHLERCAVCRAEVERQQASGALLRELGQAYRESLPESWPALSSIEARAKEADGASWWERLGERLGVRTRSLALATGVAFGVFLLAAALLVLLESGSDVAPVGGRVATVSNAPDAASPALPPAADAEAPAPQVATADTTGPAVPPAPVEPAAQGRSEVVAVSAASDVSYTMLNVPYEGGTAAVIWLSALPASDDGPGERPL